MLTWLRTWREGLVKLKPSMFTPIPSPSRPTHQLVGTIVIAAPDTGPLIIGPIMSFDGRYGIIPVVHDFLSGKTIMCASPLTMYSDATLHSLLALTPAQRYARLNTSRAFVGAKRRLTSDLSQADYLAKVSVGIAKYKSGALKVKPETHKLVYAE